MNHTRNKNLNFRSLKQVVAKASKSKDFQAEYTEELLRLRFAKELKTLRLQQKITQSDIAKKVSMPQSVIARMESGDHSFSLGTLYRVAKAFGKELQLV